MSAAETPLIPSTGAPARLVALTAAAMTFLAVCALAAALAADRIADRWRDSLARLATVSVPAEAPESALAAALEALERVPGVAGARALSEAELQALLAPWLGPESPLDQLPAPRLIEVELDGAGPDKAALEAALAAAAPGALYDDNGRWRATLARAAGGLQALAIGALAVAAVTAAAAVALASHASFAANLAIVDALRLMGAEDGFVARAFERRFAARALVGGVIGFAVAAAGLGLLPEIGEGELAIGLAPAPGDWVWLAAAPAGSALVAWATTRASVLAALRRRA